MYILVYFKMSNYIEDMYICFIQLVEMMSLFANIKSHNIDVQSISYVLIIKIFSDVPEKNSLICFSQWMMQRSM